MFLFIFLAVLLVIAIVFFITFPLLTVHMSNEQFASYCERKVNRIARRRNLLRITNLAISRFDSEKIYVDHIIFGKKYIYLITNIKLKGFVVGEENDKSWIHYNYSKKKARYISNLNELSNKNIQEFADILRINSDFFVSICLIPNNCDFKIKGSKKASNHIVHYFSLARKIRKFEHAKINALDKEQIYEQYTRIKETNEQSKHN